MAAKTLPLRTPFSIRVLTGALLALLGAACTAPAPHRAPVEDRAGARPAAPPVSAATEPRAPVEAARPGTYVVKPGDMLIRIALEHGVSYRDLARWNGLDNPNLIEVGQVLKVVPPGSLPTADGLTTRPVGGSRSDSKPTELKPLDAKGPDSKVSGDKRPAGGGVFPVGAVNGAAAASAPAATGGPASTAGGAPAASAAGANPSGNGANTATASVTPDGEPQWAWPALGTVLAPFDELRNKGVSIGGKAGDAVLAAADGRVMYAGSGLRGYGNMVIIKHNELYLSAYAHNQTVLVKEDQIVRKGQRIAEMGNSDADQVKLHFEIRRKGSPIDPTKVLPPR